MSITRTIYPKDPSEIGVSFHPYPLLFQEAHTKQVLGETASIKRGNDIVPDCYYCSGPGSNTRTWQNLGIAPESWPKKFFERADLDFQLAKIRMVALALINVAPTPITDPQMVRFLVSLGCALAGKGACGELSALAGFRFQQRKIPTSIFLLQDMDGQNHHAILHLGPTQRTIDCLNELIKTNRSYFISIQQFATKMDSAIDSPGGGYFVDPLVRSHGPLDTFGSSESASYLRALGTREWHIQLAIPLKFLEGNEEEWEFIGKALAEKLQNPELVQSVFAEGLISIADQIMLQEAKSQRDRAERQFKIAQELGP